MAKHAARRIAFVLCAGMLASSALGAQDGGGDQNNQQNNGSHGSTARFEAALLGSTPNQPIAGVPSGGAPWVATGHAALSSNGNLNVVVRGLLLAAGASINTTGPVIEVKASLACGGVVAATSSPVNLSAEGNAGIHETLTLPTVCIAPAVLIRIATTTSGPSATAPWIAATGFITRNPPLAMDDDH